jgi:hypothetical protein
VVTAGGAIEYDANRGTTILIEPGLLLGDVDNATLSGVTVAITGGHDVRDLLHFTDQAGITGSFDANTGVLTLTGNASVAAYQAALATITFSTDSQRSDLRTISWTVNDGAALSAAATTAIDITGRLMPPSDQGRSAADERPSDGNRYGYDGDTRLRTNVSGDDSPGGFSRSHGYYFVNADVKLATTGNAGIQIDLALGELTAALNGDVVSFIALQANGDPLPSWLTFDALTGQFAGLPPNGQLASIPDHDIVTGAIPADPTAVTPAGPRAQTNAITVMVVARDSRGNVAVTTFTIDLRAPGRQGWNLPLNGDWGREPKLLENPRDLAALGIGPDLSRLAAWSEQRSISADGPSADTGGNGQRDRVTFGRAGFSEKLQSVGWRAAQAERMALLNSLPRATLH